MFRKFLFQEVDDDENTDSQMEIYHIWSALNFCYLYPWLKQTKMQIVAMYH